MIVDQSSNSSSSFDKNTETSWSSTQSCIYTTVAKTIILKPVMGKVNNWVIVLL